MQLVKLGVAAIYLFGSYAEGIAGKLSDIDIGVLMENPKKVSLSLSIHPLYQKLYNLLIPLFPRQIKDIDIVFLERAPLELQAHVVRFGKLLYEANRTRRLNFEEKTILLYADFALLRSEFDKTLLQRL